MKYLSVCSGIEAATVAWHPLGWNPIAFSEIEKFPASVLQHHYPHVPNLGDMTKYKEWNLGQFDLLAGGTPCFTAGHLVLCREGYRLIEDISVGDEVVTHRGVLKKVIKVGSAVKPVGVLRGVGLNEPVTCTADHPFLTVDYRNQNTRRDGLYAKVEHCSEPVWEAASKSTGKQYCSLVDYNTPKTLPATRRTSAEGLMFLAGAYIGDGWTRKWNGKTKKAVVFGINDKKYEKLKSYLGSHTITEERTCKKVTICDTKLANFLISEFGSGAASKTLPAWVFAHPQRHLLLEGYLTTDGHITDNGFSASTISRRLAYGIASLANSCGYAASVGYCEMPKTTAIEGRTVNQKPFYQVRAFHTGKSKKSRVRKGYLLRKITGFSMKEEPERVFNIEVEEDHSYVVNGAIVHNCQSFSVAGLRKGLADERGNLALVYIHILQRYQPRWFVWENVPGVLSSNGGRDFGTFLGGGGRTRVWVRLPGA